MSGPGGWFNSWRAAVRIARRDAWRFKGRSLLVLAMIALPIVGVSAADITVRSSELGQAESIRRDLGSADARLTGAYEGNVPVYQGLESGEYQTVDDGSGRASDGGEPAGIPGDPTVAIPAGAKVLKDSTGSAKVRTTHGLLNTEIHELKAADPVAAGLMTLDRGRFPEEPGEVAATTRFLEDSGLSVGSEVSARSLDTKYLIVGAYERPDALDALELNALPGAFLEPLTKAVTAAGRAGPGATSTYLVSVAGDFTWDMVKEANTKGVVVDSRAVKMNPPADSEVPLYVAHPDWNQDFSDSIEAQASALAVVATVVGLAMLEICLLAGPAFAVGARRSRRQLGLVGANGGDRRHIRAIVLAGGLVIGVVAAVAGTVLGLGLTVALRPILENYMGARFDGVQLRPLELLGIGSLAVVTGLLAAVVPAVVASRQSVLASLTGRRGIRRANRVLPVFGLAAICLGAGVAIFGSSMTDSVLAVGGGSAIAELGVVALTPVLVGLFGRIGGRLPLSPRLALRDAVRNRGRTAPAVAAVLAAVAGTVAVSTYVASDDRTSRDQYQASLPYGTVSVAVDTEGTRDLAAIRTAVENNFGTSGRADVDRIVVGNKVCDVWAGEKGCGVEELVVPNANECPLYADDSEAEEFSVAQRRGFAKDWRCDLDGAPATIDSESGVLVGGPAVLKAFGIKDPAAEQALADGKAVVFEKRFVADGEITLGLRNDVMETESDGEDGRLKPYDAEKTFAAYSPAKGTNGYGISVLVTPAAVKAAGLRTVPRGSIFTTEQLPDSPRRQALDSAFDTLGADVSLHVEEGYVSPNNVIQLALTVFAGIVTIGAAGIATGLAQADAEPDLKTLAAIGADPRVRRTLSGFQCGVVAVMGVLLGSAAGILPAVGLRMAEERQQLTWYNEGLDQGWGGMDEVPNYPVVVPWATLAALLIAVPLGAALLAALVTRSRTQPARRAEA